MLGCPKQLAEPYRSKVRSSNYNCRCKTAPWGEKATQLLTPNATQVTCHLMRLPHRQACPSDSPAELPSSQVLDVSADHAR